jgi:hypothetical protein
MSDVIKNMIQRNKRAIFDVEALVQFNVGQIQVARSTIEENITDAQQSYLINAAGNRELIMRTTDDVFRNRLMMIEGLTPTNNDEEAFQLSMANRVKVEYLEHRSKINRKMASIALKMADAIRALSDVSQTFYELNEEMVNYIDEIADSNGQWMDGELKQTMNQASHHGNESRVNEIEEVVRSIKNSSIETRKIIEETFATGETLKDKLTALREKAQLELDTKREYYGTQPAAAPPPAAKAATEDPDFTAAKAAIAAGKDRNAVIQRYQSSGKKWPGGA